MLVGDSYNWWKEVQRSSETHRVILTWEGFRKTFLDKYFPENVKYEKEIEFLRLHQGEMTIDQYVSKFESLSKYSSCFVNNPDMTWKARKFQG